MLSLSKRTAKTSRKLKFSTAGAELVVLEGNAVIQPQRAKLSEVNANAETVVVTIDAGVAGDKRHGINLVQGRDPPEEGFTKNRGALKTEGVRRDVSDIRQLQVRNNQGQMIRLGTLLDVRDTSGPVVVMRYNMYSAIAITGDAAPGVSSGQAVAQMQLSGDVHNNNGQL